MCLHMSLAMILWYDRSVVELLAILAEFAKTSALAHFGENVIFGENKIPPFLGIPKTSDVRSTLHFSMARFFSQPLRGF